jgi:integrase
MHGMQGGNLTGHVEAIDRHRWRLIVNLPAATAGARRRYPRTVRTVEAPSRRAAERALSDWIAELEAHDCTDPSRLTLAEMCRRWLAAARFDVRPATLEFYEEKLRHVLPALGASIAADVRPADLSALYIDLASRGLSGTTAHHVHAAVRAAYSWAVREELQERNPALRVKHPPPQGGEERAIWSAEDVARAVVASRGLQVRVPLVLAAWGGLRRAEVCGLRWENVDLEAGRIWICEALEQTKGGVVHTVAPKSRAGLRLLPFPAIGVGILREHKAAQDEMRLASKGWNTKGYVVATIDGRPMKPRNLSSAWADFVRRKELPTITFHGLRHSYTTGIFDRGGENREGMLKVAQRLAGHADPMTTARIYLHATEPLLQQVHQLHDEAVEAAMAKAERGDGGTVLPIKRCP